jgi:hypothetical protein
VNQAPKRCRSIRAVFGAAIPWIIPGDRGKVEPGWLTPPLRTTRVKARVQTGAIHQFLWRRSRAVSDAKQELCGQER